MAIGRDITERLQIIAEGFEQTGRSHAAATCDEAVAEIIRLRNGIRRPTPRRSRAEERDFAKDLAEMFGLGLFTEPEPKQERALRADMAPRADPRFDLPFDS